MKLISIFLIFIHQTFALNIDHSNITISGFSSGAYMANQVFLSHSSIFSGLGIFAGGPFLCSESQGYQFAENCMKKNISPLRVKALSKLALINSHLNLLDPLKLENKKIYLFSGLKDDVVNPQITFSNRAFYKELKVPENNIATDEINSLGHSFPSSSNLYDCHQNKQSPYLASCKQNTLNSFFDFVDTELLNFNHSNSQNLFRINQQYHSKLPLQMISMDQYSWVYIPEYCQENTCGIHIALHGCLQNVQHVGLEFVKKSGYNEIAEQRNLIILYPQIHSYNSYQNPNSCWDWWGYTGPNFYNKLGSQVNVIFNLLRYLQVTHFNNFSK